MSRKLFLFVLMLTALWCTSGCAGNSTTFSDLKEKLLLNSDDATNPGAPFTAKDCPDCLFNVVNRTGQEWTDFHLETRLGSGPDGTFGFMDTASGGFDGEVYEGDGTAVLSNSNHTMDITGLRIPDGATYTFRVDVGDLELQGKWELFGRPSVAGQ